MTQKFQGALILEAPDNSPSGKWRRNIIRRIAPFALHHSFESRGIPCTLINYTENWQYEKLQTALSVWVQKHQIKKLCICVSTLFDNDVLKGDNNINRLIKFFKRDLEVTLYLGGPVDLLDYNFDEHTPVPDAVFQGRSLHLLEHVLDNKPIPAGQVRIKRGVELYYTNSPKIVEEPIIPKLYEDYCLGKDDILGFETRLGCKFNCTFCNFEFRNARDVTDATTEQLVEFFTSANKYGVTNFFCADDTFNEDQSKIDTLHNAVSQLDYTPLIVGYQRFDLLMAHPEQVQQLDECGFHGHYFGIETLHREASKLIRKGIRKEKAYEFLRYIRENFPHWYMCSGYIVGIPLEPLEHARQTVAEISEQKLINSVIPQALGLWDIPGNEHNYSDFALHPDKYGITVKKKMGTGTSMDWTHELADRKTAQITAQQMGIEWTKAGNSILDPWEWISHRVTPDQKAADKFVSDYIERKTRYLLS